MRKLIIPAIALAAAVGGASSALPRRSAAGAVDPASFTHPVANPYFPLTPGLVLRYRGSEDGEHFREVVRVTARHLTIQGVRTTIVHDVVRRADGSIAEKTADFYAADNTGKVWYFGENTATYDEDGTLESHEGSWRAGVHGAVAGTIMPAHPRPTDAYRQEFLRGQAEDQAWIVSRGARLRVPAGRFTHVVRSFEWSRLEPRVVSVKLYAPGVGIVAERDVAGGNERFVLVSISR
ncbi:MAG: hypothetical protein J7518_13865 [Nocardioidaceae bacterium]|nr:hypothetical protein [Nocardioidaceae bacterium]